MAKAKKRLISIHEPADRWLTRRAAELGISVSELVRRIIDNERVGRHTVEVFDHEEFKKRRDAFHQHLDQCQQCRDNPCRLCDEGVKLLQAAAGRAGDDRQDRR